MSAMTRSVNLPAAAPPAQRQDVELRRGVRAADPAAVGAWVSRDHPIGDLLAEVTMSVAAGGVAHAGAGGGEVNGAGGESRAEDRDAVLAAAWAATLAEIADDTGPDATAGQAGGSPAGSALRATLLLHVVDAVEAAGRLDDAPTEPVPFPGPYLTGDDRWAGWWQVEPTGWPAGRRPERSEVIAALRRLPLGLRVLLVLRDAAGLGPEAAADIIGTSADQAEVLLESARLGFVGHLDRELIDRELIGGTSR
jgi:hypothetical protein